MAYRAKDGTKYTNRPAMLAHNQRLCAQEPYEEAEEEKLDPGDAAYFHPDHIPDEGTHCSACGMWKPKGACTVVEGEIDGVHGVCDLFVMAPTENGEQIPRLLSKPEVGYIIDAPTHCGNCRFFYPADDNDQGECEKISGIVDYHGCCNLWRKNLSRGE